MLNPASNSPHSLAVGHGALKHASDLCLQFCAGVFSFEVAFILFVFAGQYKADPRLSWVPIDLTLLFLLLSAAAAGWVLFRRSFRFSRAALFIAFGIILFLTWMIVSVAWTPSRVYGPQKALELGTLVLWAGVAPALVIAPEPARFRRFTHAVMLFTGLVCVGSINGYLQFGGTAAEENYLSLGRLAGFSAAIALVQLSGRGSWLNRLWLSLLLLLYAFLLWTSGARGPFLAALFSVLVLGMGTIRLTTGRVRVRLAASILVLCLVGGIVVVWTGPESRTFNRFTVLLTQESGGRSAGARLHYFEGTVDVVSRAPFVGHGIGGWPIEMGYTDGRRFPHNIFLETLAEGGVIGVLLLTIAIAIGLRHLFIGRIFDEPMKLTVLLLFVNTFINAQTSGDISDNRLFFSTIGLMAIALAPSARVEDVRSSLKPPQSGRP